VFLCQGKANPVPFLTGKALFLTFTVAHRDARHGSEMRGAGREDRSLAVRIFFPFPPRVSCLSDTGTPMPFFLFHALCLYPVSRIGPSFLTEGGKATGALSNLGDGLADLAPPFPFFSPGRKIFLQGCQDATKGTAAIPLVLSLAEKASS